MNATFRPEARKRSVATNLKNSSCLSHVPSISAFVVLLAEAVLAIVLYFSVQETLDHSDALVLFVAFPVCA
jgi:hypothetical protein